MRDGFQIGIMVEGHFIVPGGWVPFNFTLNHMIASTFWGRLSSGGC